MTRVAMACALLAALLASSRAHAVVALQKRVSGPAVIGGRITYEIDLQRNSLLSSDRGVVLHDVTPPGHTLLSIAQQGQPPLDCTTQAGGSLGGGVTATCTPTDITLPDVVDSYVFFITYRTNNTSSSNVASASCGATANCAMSNTATATLTPAPLALMKTASVSQVQPGASFDYTLTLTQSAPSDVVGITVHDDLPDLVTVTSVDASVAGAPVTIGAKTVDIGPLTTPLPPGKHTFVLHATLDKSAQGSITNRATATAPGGTPVPSNALTLPVVQGPPPVSISKTVSSPTAKIGETVSFQITATPSGAPPGPIVITDPLDPALKLTSLTINSQPVTCAAAPSPVGTLLVSCGPDGRQLRVEVPAGQTLDRPLSITLGATLLPTAPPQLTNVATLTVGPATQQALATLQVANAATGASLLVTAGKALAEKGDLVPFVVTVGVPSGAMPLANPLLLLGSTSGLRIGDVRLQPPSGPAVIARPVEQNGALMLPLPSLPAGATATVTVRARVGPRAQPGNREALSAQLALKEDGTRLAGAQAEVRIVADAEFDLGTLLGDVYRDENGNGVRDRGERGVEGATVVLDDGLQAVTDAEGRYHLSAVIPGDRALKLARHTLPPGTRLVTDETRVVLITPGSLVKVDFGVQVPAPEAHLPEARGMAAPPGLRRADDGGLHYRLAGQAQPGARVQVEGRPATVDRKTGAWTSEVALKPGRNRLAVVTAWPDGRVVISARDLFLVERPGGGVIIPRDEEPHLVLRFPPGSLAEPSFTLEGKALHPLAALTVAGQPLGADAEGRVKVKLRVPESGAAVHVEARFSDGLEARFDHSLEPNGDFFLLVGLADGKLGYVQRDGAAGQSGLYAQGRVKLYTKGRIQGRWLLEGGLDVDSAQLESWRDLFRGDPQRLFRNLDPDRFYTVYGDASQVSQQAQSRARLFVRIELDRSELRFGNIETGLTGVELGRYQRAATGGRISYVRASPDDPNGPPTTQVIVFGAWLQTARAHDELKATGGSLYYLAHKSVVEGSENVRIEVRDKISDRPVANVAERATADYEIDYLAGRILLREPLSSVAASPTLIRSGAVDGDRNFLVVDYEYIVDGDLDDGTVGARVTQKLGPVRIGGTVANEFRAVGSYTLLGADVQLDLKKWGVVVAEYAHSYGSLSSFGRSDDGGLSYSDAEGRQAATGKREGNAWKVEADLHGWGRVDLHPYARGIDQGYTDTAHAQDAGFIQWGVEGNVLLYKPWQLKLRLHYDERRWEQQAFDATGAAVTDASGKPVTASATHRDVGGEFGATFGRVALRVGARSERDDDPDPLRAGHRTTVGARADVRIVPRLTLYGAGQYAVEHGGDGWSGLDNSLGALGLIADLGWDTRFTAEGSYGALGPGGLVGLKTELGKGRVLYGTVTLSQDRDDRLATTVATGGRERITDRAGNARAILFAEDQFRNGSTEPCLSRIGCDAGGKAHVLATGVDVPLSKRFVLGATFERGTLEPSGTPFSQLTPSAMPIERTAGTLYGSYGGDAFRAQVRGELRADSIPNQPTPLQWLVSGMLTARPHKDVTLRGKLFVSRALDASTTLARSTEITTGFAWRPSFTDRVALLGRYTFLDEFSPRPQATTEAVDPATGTPLTLRERAHVLSLAADGRVVWRFSLGEKVGAKLKEEPTLGTSAWLILWVNRLSFHVTRRWDAVVEYRLLTVPGATLTHGVSIEANVIVVGHLRLGAGYNFSDFSDDELTLGRGSEKGFFVRAQGFY